MRISDWSSDVCSSDLDGGVLTVVFRQRRRRGVGQRRGGGFERGDACERIVPVRGRGSRAAERGDGVADMQTGSVGGRSGHDGGKEGEVGDRKSTRLNSSN